MSSLKCNKCGELFNWSWQLEDGLCEECRRATMSNDKMIVRSNPLVKSLANSLRAGSLTDLVRSKQSDNIYAVLDTSGSMGSTMANGKRRIDGLREVMKDIQSEREMPMIQFGNGWEPSVCSSIPDASGGTPLAEAIDLAKRMGAGRAIVVSDGVPDNQHTAMEAAQRFAGRIDVVFVGDPGEPGEAFLKRLAESTGGESFTGDLKDPKQLTGQIIGLLTDGSDADDDD